MVGRKLRHDRWLVAERKDREQFAGFSALNHQRSSFGEQTDENGIVSSRRDAGWSKLHFPKIVQQCGAGLNCGS